ncbi:hypothetical protein Glove_242g12 [Diversispora epigaea]|uniref:Uncharacterized protein n=1 Tax=Diversispora epigaea TaxID=1348612 RepID=A0A397ICI7_9GLOM|nr:hypothetical protein Glove_242g12 [Diversispora epigaea]
MSRKRQKTSSVTVFSRVKEHENVFHVDNGLLFDRQNLTKESLKQLNMMYFNLDY